jgi:hypothetical protein
VANVTEWPSEEAFRAAHARPEFPAMVARVRELADTADSRNYELAWELPTSELQKSQENQQVPNQGA